MKRVAAFLDRDGTLIDDAHYLNDPSGIRLVEGAVEAVRLLNDAGVPVVVVTFIAMLELAKEHLIEVTQAEAYAPIYVRLAYETT